MLGLAALGLVVWGIATLDRSPPKPDTDILPPTSPLTYIPVPPSPGVVVTGDLIGSALSVAAYALAADARQTIRIENEGIWAAGIVEWIRALPNDWLYWKGSRGCATEIVSRFGFGGSWRIGYDDPVAGMDVVLITSDPNTLLDMDGSPSYNLQSIHNAFQDKWQATGPEMTLVGITDDGLPVMGGSVAPPSWAGGSLGTAPIGF